MMREIGMKEQSKRKEICKGCIMTRVGGSYCAYVDHNREEECPCIDCLVKVMCNDVCYKRKFVSVGTGKGDTNDTV